VLPIAVLPHILGMLVTIRETKTTGQRSENKEMTGMKKIANQKEELVIKETEIRGTVKKMKGDDDMVDLAVFQSLIR
jgi:hypothetical protein